MKRRLLASFGLLLALAPAASAHRLDEYLQATLISIERDRVQVSLRLIPGIAVSSAVIASVDRNGDGVLSPDEQHAYAERVLGDLSLTLDGRPVQPKLLSVAFPVIERMREGIGEIHIEYTAALPNGGGNRTLVLESHNHTQRAVYLVNSLVPHDSAIQIVAQKRNEQQSWYELDYTQRNSAAPHFGSWTGEFSALGLPSLFRLGVRHIAEGTDHLLFLLVLLLPAPLLAAGSRWAGVAGARCSLMHILGIVTAFTVGHSITLALAAFGVIHVPSRPIEVLIAISILVSAIHALRPIFPGREAAIAAFFGLIHGLAFASTLSELGLGRWERVAGILAFNVGIETMQMAVVAATLPSLLLLSRTRWYAVFRVGGAGFAVAASAGWIAERLFGVSTSVDLAVNEIAHHAGLLAGGIFLVSLFCWRQSMPRREYGNGAGVSATQPPATEIAR